MDTSETEEVCADCSVLISVRRNGSIAGVQKVGTGVIEVIQYNSSIVVQDKFIFCL